jgi:hypothetical protein
MTGTVTVAAAKVAATRDRHSATNITFFFMCLFHPLPIPIMAVEPEVPQPGNGNPASFNKT